MRRVCGLLGIVLALPFVPNALAEPPRGETVNFVTHLTDPGDYLTLGGVDPTCQVGQVVIRGSAQLQGQLRAIDTGAGCLSWDPVAQLSALQSNDGPAFAASGYIDDHPNGTLDGCGKGSFTMRLYDLKITSFDPVARTFHLTLQWTIPPRSGIRAFRGATGDGTGSLEASFSPDFTVPPLTAPVVTPNWGTYQGTITCPHRGE